MAKRPKTKAPKPKSKTRTKEKTTIEKPRRKPHKNGKAGDPYIRYGRKRRRGKTVPAGKARRPRQHAKD